METKRASWASNLGFLMAAIGSAVGLGNIWGFPYKMGKSGGFAYLAVYALLAIFVGFIVMASELAMGRKTGQGAMGTYHALTKKFRWIGWLALFSPFAVMGFYAVLGGYCIEYMALNLSNFAFGSESLATGGELFAAMLSNPAGAVLFAALFLALCYLINRSGISGGIEKFNNVGMPTLFVMLVVIIIRSLTLPGAMEGLKFMFVPGYAVEAGFVAETPSLLSVFASAGGQMFFSLSLAMGAMIT
ncbi:MAG: sodium-dependent transporter, partial [Dysosmobacter sp.]|nr:sodium-dependent transporter [Dysosmobacter sp.]